MTPRKIKQLRYIYTIPTYVLERGQEALKICRHCKAVVFISLPTYLRDSHSVAKFRKDLPFQGSVYSVGVYIVNDDQDSTMQTVISLF